MKEIPCPHQNPFYHNSLETLPDHHRLSREEIIDLMEEAKVSDEPTAAQISRRLIQGIPGMVCPVPFFGPLAERAMKLSLFFIQNYTKGSAPDVVDGIISLLSE